MTYYSAPLTINWTLSDLHQATLRLQETKDTEYAQLLGTLRVLATSYPTSEGGFKTKLEVTYANLREVLRGV